MNRKSPGSLDEIVADDFKIRDMYEFGNKVLTEIIPVINKALIRPYSADRNESDIITPMMGYGTEPGIFVAIKYNGKTITDKDRDIIVGWNAMEDVVMPVLEDLYAKHGIPIYIGPVNHTIN